MVFVGPKKNKNIFKIRWSTERFVFFEFIYFILTYVLYTYITYVLYIYASSLLLSSENMCGTRPFKWGTQ